MKNIIRILLIIITLCLLIIGYQIFFLKLLVTTTEEVQKRDLMTAALMNKIIPNPSSAPPSLKKDYSLVEFVDKLNFHRQSQLDKTEVDKQEIFVLINMLPIYIDRGEISPIEGVLAGFVLLAYKNQNGSILEIITSLVEVTTLLGGYLSNYEYENLERLPSRLLKIKSQ
jgi:hypothetical protein